jgi:hypothetical protein
MFDGIASHFQHNCIIMPLPLQSRGQSVLKEGVQSTGKMNGTSW